MDDLSSPMVASRDSGREAEMANCFSTDLLGDPPFTKMSIQLGNDREGRESPSYSTGSRGKNTPFFSIGFPLPLVHFLLNLRCISSNKIMASL